MIFVVHLNVCNFYDIFLSKRGVGVRPQADREGKRGCRPSLVRDEAVG